MTGGGVGSGRLRIVGESGSITEIGGGSGSSRLTVIGRGGRQGMLFHGIENSTGGDGAGVEIG